MPRQSPYDIKLSKAERAELLARSRCYASRYRDVIRAKIVLLASDGMAKMQSPPGSAHRAKS